MRFDITDEQRLARDVTRSFLAVNHPLSAVRESLRNANGVDAALWRKAAALGWTSPLLPESHGGGGVTDAPLVDLSVFATEIGRAVAPGPFVETTVTIDALAHASHAPLRDRLLPALLEGSVVSGWAVDCCTSGSVLARSSSGEVTLNGDVLAAVAGSDALLLVSTPSVSCLIEFPTAGVSVTPLEWLDSSARHAIVRFDAVTVAETHVLSTEGADFERFRCIAWVLQAAELAGVVDAVFDLTLQWLSSRYSFGRPLASYQALKHRCADMKTMIEATHAIADAAADAVSERSPESGLLSRAAKAYAATHATEIIQDCVQLHGGMGVTWEHDLHLYLRRAVLIANTYGAPSQLFDDVAAVEMNGVVS